MVYLIVVSTLPPEARIAIRESEPENGTSWREQIQFVPGQRE
jgi:hypothetical protein